MSGDYHFGVGRGRLSASDVERRDRIARQHGACFVYAQIPGDGWRSWYAGPNLGHPFNDALAARVLEAVDADQVVRR